MLKSLKKCLKMAKKYGFLTNSSGHINNFRQIMYFLQKNRLFRERVALNMFTKLTRKRERGSANADKADKGGRGGWVNADNG